MLLPDQLTGLSLTTSQLASQVRDISGPAVVASFVGDGPQASDAQHAVVAALSMDAGLPAEIVYAGLPVPHGRGVRYSGVLAPGSPIRAAASRFAALPEAARRAWLTQHLKALRAGQITLEQLP